jgi:pimeloyl-ACP methyl ester carboxylesterase
VSKTVSKAEAHVDYLKVNVNGYQAHYLKAGSGPPVLLIHGGASDSRDWLDTMAALSHRCTLYAPDLIGFGQNERKSEGYYLSEFSDFILEFMDAVGLESPSIVGHSFGGRICLDIALQHPERVSKLVLADSSGLGKVSRFGTVLLTGFWAIRQLFRIPQPYPKFLAREDDNPDWACADKLPGLKTPTLIIWKRHDPYLPLSVARRAAELLPDARLAVIPGFGHAPHKKNQAAFNRYLLDYLDSEERIR